MSVPSVGVCFSGACGLPLFLRARKPQPCALRSSARPARVAHAPVIQHHSLGLGLCLSLQCKQLSLVYFFLPSACACALKLPQRPELHCPEPIGNGGHFKFTTPICVASRYCNTVQRSLLHASLAWACVGLSMHPLGGYDGKADEQCGVRV